MSEKIFLFIFAISLAIAGIIIIPNARTAVGVALLLWGNNISMRDK